MRFVKEGTHVIRINEEVFWSRVGKSSGPKRCREWIGSKQKSGYGQFTVYRDGKKAKDYSHRIAWRLKHGAIPKGMFVLHKCDNPPCVEHLFLGTNKINMHDCIAKGRFKTPLVKGHRLTPRGEKNHWAKLTDITAGQMKADIREGRLLQREIAEKYHVHRSTVRRVQNGEKWAWV